MGFLRRLRGLVGIATTWGIAFSVMMTALFIGRWILGPSHGASFGVRQFVIAGIEFFLMGGLAGTLFSLFFARGERRHTLETLSMPRVALWGFLGVGIPQAALTLGATLVYGRGFVIAPLSIAIAGAMGSAMSVATIKLAQRAPALPEHTEI